MNTSDLTTVDFEGTGIFDVLMKSIKLHLEREYNENRITGNDYSTAYTSLMSAAIQASVQYALAKPTAEIEASILQDTKADTLDKARFEKLFLFWKAQNEKAQSFDVVQEYPDDANSLMAVNGVLGKQKQLYQNQSEGYIKDAVVKAAKVYADVAMLQLNVDENYNNSTNGLADIHIAEVMNKLKTSV